MSIIMNHLWDWILYRYVIQAARYNPRRARHNVLFGGPQSIRFSPVTARSAFLLPIFDQRWAFLCFVLFSTFRWRSLARFLINGKKSFLTNVTVEFLEYFLYVQILLSLNSLALIRQTGQALFTRLRPITISFNRGQSAWEKRTKQNSSLLVRAEEFDS